MSIADLMKLVPPPAKPFEVGTLAEWAKVEAELGTQLPQDYRDFVFAYGSGLFAGLYRVYNPFSGRSTSPYCHNSKKSAIGIGHLGRNLPSGFLIPIILKLVACFPGATTKTEMTTSG